jgi:hypothetical protein
MLPWGAVATLGWRRHRDGLGIEWRREDPRGAVEIDHPRSGCAHAPNHPLPSGGLWIFLRPRALSRIPSHLEREL